MAETRVSFETERLKKALEISMQIDALNLVAGQYNAEAASQRKELRDLLYSEIEAVFQQWKRYVVSEREYQRLLELKNGVPTVTVDISTPQNVSVRLNGNHLGILGSDRPR